ncbi:hypothetical protein ABPG75_001509 [Micractinium tetrahymenae]
MPSLAAVLLLAAALAATAAAAQGHVQPIRHGRALAEATPPPSQLVKYAPCNAMVELTCAGVPSQLLQQAQLCMRHPRRHGRPPLRCLPANVRLHLWQQLHL